MAQQHQAGSKASQKKNFTPQGNSRAQRERLAAAGTKNGGKNDKKK